MELARAAARPVRRSPGRGRRPGRQERVRILARGVRIPCFLVKQFKGAKAVAQLLGTSQRTVERYVKDQIKKAPP